MEEKILDLLEEICEDDIIREERKLNLRRSGRRGFDVIRQVFFVEEWENTGDNGDELHQDEKLFGN